MLSRNNTLKKSEHFQKVHRSGRLFSFGVIFLKVTPNQGKLTRIGFSIGLKFSKKAAERNRVKRQLRHIAGKNISKIKGGLDLVIGIRVTGKKEFISLDLEKDLKKALEKGNLIIK